MSSTAALRPGVVLGAYPQRDDQRRRPLDALATSITGVFRQFLYGRSPGHEAFLALVGAEAATLEGLADAQLKALVPDLRRRLYSEGLDERLVARSFAIVREVASRRLGMRHFDVQLLGGKVMLEGKIAEMETGEGKTLTATLPACTAALAGIPVHVVTVNDFLVQRDAAWMAPLYKFFGLSVGTITEDSNPQQRRRAYASDITYCTNKQLVFDYLKDRIVVGREAKAVGQGGALSGSAAANPNQHLLLRGLCFVIIDEADSVLVDEARTPLIISGMGDTRFEQQVYGQAIEMARQLDAARDFSIRPRERDVELSDAGKRTLAELAAPWGGLWVGPRRREELIKRALSALHLFHRNKHYLVRDGKIQIIDEYTGRVMADRSWERGLHQMIEAKEGCQITGQQETLARISYQRFFRRYLRVAGMTGTAREVARELWSVYRLPVVSIPTNRPVRRQLLPDRVFASADEKWAAIVETARRMQQAGRPVLIGTRSVMASEHLSELLTAAGLDHQVLNARQDQGEAKIVSRAGESGRITVATNMAGRGTDIRLADGVGEAGGLHVIATERHDARRIDRQLFGRAGRQGDPGSCEAIVSLEDEIVAQHLARPIARALSRLAAPGSPLPGAMARFAVDRAQRAAERDNARVRRELLKIDDQLSDMLAFSGRSE
jgi:preprotein translocase subunit SecA